MHTWAMWAPISWALALMEGSVARAPCGTLCRAPSGFLTLWGSGEQWRLEGKFAQKNGHAAADSASYALLSHEQAVAEISQAAEGSEHGGF